MRDAVWFPDGTLLEIAAALVLRAELQAAAADLEAADAGRRDSAAPVRRAPFDPVTAGDLNRAESGLKRLEWQRRAQRALDLAR